MIRSLNIVFCIMIILLCTACSSEEQDYQFPLKKEDVEKALSNQKLDWSVDDVVKAENSQQVIFSLKGNNGITYSIASNVYENSKILFMTWVLPSEFTTDQFNEFYRKSMPEFFDLAGILYGNSKELKKGFREFSGYFKKAEGDFEGGLYWTNRIGDNHLQIETKPFPGPQDKRNRVGTLLIVDSISYEHFQKISYENWKKSAQFDSTKISDSTVEELKEHTPTVNEEDYHGEYFVIRGHLEDIKKIHVVPDSLKNTISNQFLKPNKDKYLSAKLVDDTGSIDVFLQTTSLNAEELSKDRNHNAVLFYYEQNPFFVIRFSPLSE